MNIAFLSNIRCTGAVNNEEEVTWDDDSDDAASEAGGSGGSDAAHSTPQATQAKDPEDSNPHLVIGDKEGRANSGSPRRSNDQQSQPDSESSYDLVSGSASRAAESPKEKTPLSSTAEDSEEDWE